MLLRLAATFWVLFSAALVFCLFYEEFIGRRKWIEVVGGFSIIGIPASTLAIILAAIWTL